MRSLITLKALTYAPTGGIVAAPTTSLPERIGGVRNWDYRYCWLRDATFTLYALIDGGYIEEARAWRDWLLRAVAGDPAQLQIMYGVAGERRLDRVRARLAARLRGLGAGAHRQRRRTSSSSSTCTARSSTRCTRPARMAIERGPERVGAAAGACSSSSSGAGSEPDEGIWEVRGPAPALHALEGDGLGGVRPRGARRSSSSASRARSTVAARAATRSTHEVCAQGLRRRAQHVHPVLRLEAARRQRC